MSLISVFLSRLQGGTHFSACGLSLSLSLFLSLSLSLSLSFSLSLSLSLSLPPSPLSPSLSPSPSLSLFLFHSLYESPDFPPIISSPLFYDSLQHLSLSPSLSLPLSLYLKYGESGREV